jgi:adenosylmethionine-8-amino-7-oxononanoate aminotransferase
MDAERAQVYPFIGSPGSTPLVIERTEGAYLITPDGRRILDAAGGAIVVNIGHGRREVAEAFARGATEATYVVPPFATESRVRLVERLRTHWLPAELTRVVFTSGGSESMDAAIRLARQHHVSAGRRQRWKVIGRDLSYHGTTLATLAIGGHLKRRDAFEPWLTPLPKAPACYCLRCPLGLRYPDCAVACADELEHVIEREGAETIAAFVAEPIVGSTAGAVVPPDEYWPRVADICRRHGVLLIADEVMTGFGRTGRRFAVEHWDIVPDILVGGKGLTGGYAPMGAIFARESVVAPIAERGDELMFYTYSAHPGCCAVADKVLEIIEREHLVERAAEMGRRLRERLSSLEAHPNVGQIRGRGLLLGVELVKDRATLEPFPKEAGLTTKVVVAGLGEGTFFYPGGCEPARDVITIGPPFIITDEEVDRIASSLERAITTAVSWVAARSA